MFRSNANNLRTVLWLLVYLSDTNNCMVSSNFFYSIIIVCWYTVIWLQVFNENVLSTIIALTIQIIYNYMANQAILSNAKNLQTSTWPINRTLTGTTIPGQSEPGSNDNEELIHTPQSSRTRASPPDAVLCHTQIIPFFSLGLTLLQETQHILNSFNRIGEKFCL